MLNNLSIQVRLRVIGFSASIGILLVGLFGLYQLAGMDNYFSRNLAEVQDGITELADEAQAQIHFKVQVQEFKNVLLRGQNAEALVKYSKAFEKEGEQVQQKLKAAADLYVKEGEVALAKQLDAIAGNHRTMTADYLAAIKAFDPADAESYKKADAMVKGKDRAVQEALSKTIEEKEAEEKRHLAQQIADAETMWVESRNIALTGMAIIVVAITLFIIAMSRQIAAQVMALRTTTANISRDFDLTLRAPDRNADELSDVGRSLNGLLGEFQQVIGGLKNDANQVSNSSHDLSTAISQLSDSVNTQVEATSSMAAAMEEMTVSIAHVSEAAKTSSETSEQSLALATQGYSAINQTVEAMNVMAGTVRGTADAVIALGNRSKEIGSIAGVIKDIADQTNLLALNAAIEAARAGETGRGFAVVADEVRKLAERTANATTEISSVINAIQSDTGRAVSDMQNIVGQVDQTTSAARDAGDVMQKIRSGAEKVLATASEIAVALREQSAASEAVAQDVERIVGMSDENNQALESVRSAAHGMRDLAADMNHIAARFKA